MPKTCKKDEILRKGSIKKSHSRKLSSGKKIKVKQSRMSEVCITDIGQPGKGPKTLPPLGDDIHLSNFGYNLSATKLERQKSLKKASKKHSTLKVLKRTNLIANYSKANKKNYTKLRQDVEYLKNQYSKESMSGPYKNKKNKKNKKNTKKISKKN